MLSITLLTGALLKKEIKKMINNIYHQWKVFTLLIVSLLLIALLGACGGGSDSTADDNDPQVTRNTPYLDMEIPESITGGQTADLAGQESLRASSSRSAMPCAFMGADDDDPFRNGYEMTKFMVSVMATWTCYADTLIDIADNMAHDGILHATENDPVNGNYDPDEPTHYLISDDSETQTSIFLYYGYDRSSPPLPEDDPQFFLSWNTTEEGDINGRLIIDSAAIDEEDRNPEDPVTMRMDFNNDKTQEVADMFLRFDENNAWADGFRIQVTKDLTVGLSQRVFTALGLMKMKAQFHATEGISEIPNMHMFTVSDAFGNGAALAEFEQLSIPLELNGQLGNHLGNYLFDKQDIYFFDDDMDWDWIEKTISAASYRGGRTTPQNGGTWEPFDPSQDMIITALALDSDYFTGDKCAELDGDCTELLNAVFEDGFADQEPNQGADPMDWRSDAIASPTKVDSVYPNGVDWDGAFDIEFTP